MDREDLRNEVIYNLQNRADKNTQIDSALDLALEEIGKAHDFKDMLSLQSDADWYKVTLTFTDGAWTALTRTLTKAAAFADYSFTSGDKIYISAGTDFTAGWYEIASRTSDDAIVLTDVTGLSTGDEINVAATYMGDPGSYVLPSTTLRVTSAILVDGVLTKRLSLKTRDWIDEHYPHPEEDLTGHPHYGFTEGGRLYVVPWCSGAYEVRLTISELPTMASSDASEPTLTTANYALICWATSHMFDQLEKELSADRWMRRYYTARADAIESDMRKPAVEHVADPRVKAVTDPLSIPAIDKAVFE